MKKLSYNQRLANLKLESLELRRLRADLFFTYKLVFGAAATNQLYLPSCKSSIRFNSYPYHVLSTWNDLSPSETDFSSLTRFKLSLTPKQLEMWANAQPDGRPAEYRWRPLFNAAKFG